MSSAIAVISSLIKKEFKLEFRNKVSLTSMLLYITSTIFVCFQSFKEIVDVQAWNALLWIIILFSAVNAVQKSFYNENRSQQMYFYLLAKPQHIIIAKIIYNMILINLLTLAGFVIFSIMLPLPGENLSLQGHIGLVVVLGATGISSILTLVSAIAAKTNNNLGLISILAFPVMIPLIISIIRAGKNAADFISLAANGKYLLVIGGLDLLIITLSFILFPYLWRE